MGAAHLFPANHYTHETESPLLQVSIDLMIHAVVGGVTLDSHFTQNSMNFSRMSGIGSESKRRDVVVLQYVGGVNTLGSAMDELKL